MERRKVRSEKFKLRYDTGYPILGGRRITGMTLFTVRTEAKTYFSGFFMSSPHRRLSQMFIFHIRYGLSFQIGLHDVPRFSKPVPHPQSCSLRPPPHRDRISADSRCQAVLPFRASFFSISLFNHTSSGSISVSSMAFHSAIRLSLPFAEV